MPGGSLRLHAGLMDEDHEMDFANLASGHQAAACKCPPSGAAFAIGNVETYRGNVVLRGRLSRLYDTWFDDAAGDIEHREAALVIEDCPGCSKRHVHGWVPGDPVDLLSYRISHCRAFPSYFIGLLTSGHCCDPATPIRRAVRRRGAR